MPALSTITSFLKPNKNKLLIFALLCLLAFISVAYATTYSLGWAHNPNALYLDVALYGPTYLVSGTAGALLKLAWLYFLSSILGYLYHTHKVLFSLILMVFVGASVLSLNLYAMPRGGDWTAFRDALLANDATQCAQISPQATISGDEIEALVAETAYDNRKLYLTYIDGFNMQKTCHDLVTESAAMQLKYPKQP